MLSLILSFVLLQPDLLFSQQTDISDTSPTSEEDKATELEMENQASIDSNEARVDFQEEMENNEPVESGNNIDLSPQQTQEEQAEEVDSLDVNQETDSLSDDEIDTTITEEDSTDMESEQDNQTPDEVEAAIDAIEQEGITDVEMGEGTDRPQNMVVEAQAGQTDSVSIRDYSIPESSSLDLKVHLQLLWSNIENTDSGINNYIEGKLDFLYFYTNPHFLIRLDAYSTIAYTPSLQELADQELDKYHQNYPIQFEVRGFENSGMQYYPWEEYDFFLFLFIPSCSYTYYDPHVSSQTSGGLGYGRTTDVTAMVKARRINEFLIEENIVIGYFPREIMIKLATLLDSQIEAEYELEYGSNYKAFWYADIAAVIEEANMYAEGKNLGAVGIYRIDQVIENAFGNIWVQRFFGWDVSLGAGLTIYDPYANNVGEGYVQFLQRLYLPLGWSFQFNETFSALSHITEKEEFAKNVELEFNVGFAIEISPLFILDFEYSFIYEDAGEDFAFNRENNFSLDINFLLKNRLYIIITGTISHKKFNLISGDFQWEERIDFALSYDII